MQIRRIEDCDPAWAWQPWEASDQEPWDRKRVSFLIRRAGFGASESQVLEAQKKTPAEVIEGLFEVDGDRTAEFERESNELAVSMIAGGEAKNLSTWWLHRMLHSPQQLLEKMTLFWHGHFATGAEKVIDPELMLDQNRLLRSHAMGDFKALVHGIAKDPAMLIYLDSVTNRKAHPNENFARELMELFCLGEGHYSEADVQQLARCFTGWEIRRKKFRFNPYQHDAGTKQLLGVEVQTGEAAIDQVLGHPKLPYFIARKLFHVFVCDEPKPLDALIEPLATQLVKDNLQMSGVLKKLLGSQLMLSDWSVGRKVRSPIELSIGLMRTMQTTGNLDQLSNRLREVGQAVFFPPNVKGWDGGRAWVNSSTLVGRANLVYQLIRDDKTRFAGGALNEWLKQHELLEPEAFLNWFSVHFLAVPLSEGQRNQLLRSTGQKSGDRLFRDWLSLLATMPQFQLS